MEIPARLAGEASCFPSGENAGNNVVTSPSPTTSVEDVGNKQKTKKE
jgi:hypothetical protein